MSGCLISIDGLHGRAAIIEALCEYKKMLSIHMASADQAMECLFGGAGAG